MTCKILAILRGMYVLWSPATALQARDGESVVCSEGGQQNANFLGQARLYPWEELAFFYNWDGTRRHREHHSIFIHFT
jgi:hypothetical protein